MLNNKRKCVIHEIRLNKAQASFVNNIVTLSFTLGGKTTSQCRCVIEDQYKIRHFRS